MCSSFCTGWAPNQGKFAVADRMEGPWSSLENFGDETTYDSQPAFILRTYEGKYLYYGDRWDSKDYFNSSYVLLPLEVSEDKMSIDFYHKAVLTDQGNIEFIND
jgi:hypothetical protein